MEKETKIVMWTLVFVIIVIALFVFGFKALLNISTTSSPETATSSAVSATTTEPAE